jgi:hypothetical protein
MKKTLIVMILSTFLFSLNGTAQKQNKNKKETFSWNKKYMNQLDFNVDLQDNIIKVNTEFNEKIKLIRDDEALSKEDKKEEIKKLNKQKNKKINSLLSPEEKKRTAALKKELRDKRENG